MTSPSRRRQIMGAILTVALGVPTAALVLARDGESNPPSPTSPDPAVTSPWTSPPKGSVVGEEPVTVIAVRVTQTRRVRSLAEGDPGPAATVIGTGTLRPRHEVRLAFPLSGVVSRVEVDDGAHVHRGDTLATLDPIPFQAAVAEAAAQVRFLSARRNRSRELYAADAISFEAFDASRSELGRVQAQLELARWNLDRSVLRAPFSGAIRTRHLEAGQVVSAQVPAFDLLTVDALEVEVPLPARDLSRLDADAWVRVRVADRPEVSARGRVDHPPVTSDPRSGTVPVLVAVPNPDGMLLPGLLVTCEFGASGVDPARATPHEVRVPISALRIESGGSVVLTVTDGVAVAVPVRTGRVRGDEIVILEGILAGEPVIDSPPDRLQSGDRVRITPPDPSPALAIGG